MVDVGAARAVSPMEYLCRADGGAGAGAEPGAGKFAGTEGVGLPLRAVHRWVTTAWLSQCNHQGPFATGLGFVQVVALVTPAAKQAELPCVFIRRS